MHPPSNPFTPHAPCLRKRVRHAWIVACLGIALGCGSARGDFQEKVVAAAKESTVLIITTSEGEALGVGSGFVLSREGHVATNHHVLAGADSIVLVYGRGTKCYIHPMNLVAELPEKDLAILHCEQALPMPPMTLTDRETSSGQKVMAVGFPGILSAVYEQRGGLSPGSNQNEFEVDPENASAFVPVTFPGHVGKEMPIPTGPGRRFHGIAHDAKISEGNSGGPLIDTDGRVVGINANVARSDFGVDYAFAVHARELVDFARAHSIPIQTSSTPLSIRDRTSVPPSLLILLAVLVFLMLLLLLRKPRMALADAVSRVVPSVRRRHGHVPMRASPEKGTRAFLLRGRDLQGNSFSLTFAEQDFRRHGGRLVLGRRPGLCNLVLSHDSVSRQHCTLSLLHNTVHVEDRNSGNGTRIDGRLVALGSPPAPIHPGQKLTVGEVELVFESRDT